MNWILVITGIVTALAVLIYTVFAGLQWWAIREQGAYASEQVEKMQLQLDAMKDQGLLMDASLLESQKLALQTEKAAFFSKMQADIMQVQATALTTQVEIMGKSFLQTAQLVEQNERAVKAAEANVETVEKTAIYANRAYVTASIQEIYDGFKMYLRIENGGNTPANDVRVIYDCGLRDDPPYTTKDGELTAYDIGAAHHETIGVIPPKGHRPISTPQGSSLTGPEHQRWKLGQVKFYCWGTIIEDIFNEPRRTEFCFYQSQGSPKGDQCEHYNRAD